MEMEEMNEVKQYLTWIQSDPEAFSLFEEINEIYLQLAASVPSNMHVVEFLLRDDFSKEEKRHEHYLRNTILAMNYLMRIEKLKRMFRSRVEPVLN